MKLLLHICCGPCSISPIAQLREKGHELQGYFFNPNIHPFKEFERRLDTLIEYAEAVELPLIVDDRLCDRDGRKARRKESDRWVVLHCVLRADATVLPSDYVLIAIAGHETRNNHAARKPTEIVRRRHACIGTNRGRIEVDAFGHIGATADPVL